ncbi:MAG: hypothetical protein JRH20_31045 [Deltaproteobacteria bacterium]|nr:hypothetical protein [Deltaproteobacteria bacterium]
MLLCRCPDEQQDGSCGSEGRGERWDPSPPPPSWCLGDAFVVETQLDLREIRLPLVLENRDVLLKGGELRCTWGAALHMRLKLGGLILAEIAGGELYEGEAWWAVRHRHPP